jgi:hypothetical protein
MIKTDGDVKWFLVFIVCSIVAIMVFVTYQMEQVQKDMRIITDVKNQCLRCGYPDVTHDDEFWYCLKLESGTDIVRRLDEACER